MFSNLPYENLLLGSFNETSIDEEEFFFKSIVSETQRKFVFYIFFKGIIWVSFFLENLDYFILH